MISLNSSSFCALKKAVYLLSCASLANSLLIFRRQSCVAQDSFLCIYVQKIGHLCKCTARITLPKSKQQILSVNASQVILLSSILLIFIDCPSSHTCCQRIVFNSYEPRFITSRKVFVSFRISTLNSWLLKNCGQIHSIQRNCKFSSQIHILRLSETSF